VLDYLHQENDYGRKVMSSQQALQDQLLSEMVQRIPQRDISAPWTKNGYRYRHRYDPGNEYPVYQRQPVLSAEWDDWETLLMLTSARPTASFILGGMSISPDNAIMALAEDYLSPPVRPAFPQPGDGELVSRNAGECLTGFCLGE
jgi:oligopeptidase B